MTHIEIPNHNSMDMLPNTNFPQPPIPGLPPEVKMTELQREQLEMSKKETEGNARASCYNYTLGRINNTPELKDKMADLPYILAQADILYKWINDGLVPEPTKLTGNVAHLSTIK